MSNINNIRRHGMSWCLDAGEYALIGYETSITFPLAVILVSMLLMIWTS